MSDGRGEAGGAARLLPWAGPEGKPCYLLGGAEDGLISRMADDAERVQLDMATELLSHAADLLADHRATPPQLRYLLAAMTESLTDVHRIAVSRAGRGGAPFVAPG